jgi:hypothetical protein
MILVQSLIVAKLLAFVVVHMYLVLQWRIDRVTYGSYHAYAASQLVLQLKTGIISTCRFKHRKAGPMPFIDFLATLSDQNSSYSILVIASVVVSS